MEATHSPLALVPVSGPESLAGALVAFEEASDPYFARVAEARERLEAAEESYAGELALRSRRLAESVESRFLMSLGPDERVLLFETSLLTATAEFELNDEVSVEVEDGGDVGVLMIDGPGWRLREPFAYGVEVGELRELEWFAALLTIAAERSEASRELIAKRTAQALGELRPAVLRREPIERAAAALVSAAADTERLETARVGLADALGRVPRTRLRRPRRARALLLGAARGVTEAQEHAAAAAKRVSEESRQATAAVPQLT